MTVPLVGMLTQEENIREYYDRNTARFLRQARNGVPKAIHQPLYEHDEMSLTQAVHTQHRKILELMPEEEGGACILDLGCGVGESMLYLAQNTIADIKYYGITVSGEQATSASRRISESGLSDRVQVIEGSFQSLPPGLPSIDMGYAIESFIHSGDPDGFFAQVASVLNHGARLVIFDDFLSRPPRNNKEINIIKDLKEGWLANTLLTQSEAPIVADKNGFRLEIRTDFSGMLRLHRIRDRFVHLMVPFARPWMHRSQYCRFLVGGDARQRAYQHGLLNYAMLVFVKR